MRLFAAVISLVALLGLPTQALSQSVRFGILGGLSQTGFENGEEEAWESRTGYVVRGVADIGPVGPVSVLAVASWSTKGAERPAGTLPAPDPGSSFQLSYLSLDVLARYSPDLMKWGPIQGSLFAGPTLGLLVDCKTQGLHAERYGDAESPQEQIDCDRIDTGGLAIGVAGDNMRGADSGVAVGVQARWDFGSRVGLIEARYDYGLTNVDLILDRANRAFTLSAGLLLRE